MPEQEWHVVQPLFVHKTAWYAVEAVYRGCVEQVSGYVLDKLTVCAYTQQKL